MFGIKQSDCKFYVNENARTVVCVIPNTDSMLNDFIYENFRWDDFDVWSYMDTKMMRTLKLPHSFMGKAVCSEEDEWNEELGRMIAFSRAKNKCYKSFFKRANKLVQILDGRLGDMISTFNDFGLRLEHKHVALQQQIEERIKK